MEFTSLRFILFCFAFFSGYFFLAHQRYTSLAQLNRYIAYSSLILYLSWYPPAAALLLFYSFIGYTAGLLLEKHARTDAHRTTGFITASSIGLCLAVLFIFKYYNFFITTVGLNFRHLNVILPIGISFYTFTIIGYIVDVFQKKVKALRSFDECLVLSAFWPHLAAGPILRAEQMVNNFHYREVLTKENILLSFSLIFAGAAKKLLIADNIGSYISYNLSFGIDGMNCYEALVTLLGFSAQIYADFSGYSEMAIGFALLMGFKLPANFNYPYCASSVTDFWRRWHISLSSWFKSYVYIPLGGNKYGLMRSYRNAMVVFLLSGLWHGAGLNFILWGAIHGLAVVIERASKTSTFTLPKVFKHAITLFTVILAWAFFRFKIEDALLLLSKISSLATLYPINPNSLYCIVPIVLPASVVVIDHLVQYYQVDREGNPLLNTSVRSAIYIAVTYILGLFISGHPLPFIYFQF
jgi:alginate O-acetyltransferase complex protein AlgI